MFDHGYCSNCMATCPFGHPAPDSGPKLTQPNCSVMPLFERSSWNPGVVSVRFDLPKCRYRILSPLLVSFWRSTVHPRLSGSGDEYSQERKRSPLAFIMILLIPKPEPLRLAVISSMIPGDEPVFVSVFDWEISHLGLSLQNGNCSGESRTGRPRPEKPGRLFRDNWGRSMAACHLETTIKASDEEYRAG
jgi:hypothetical protein